MRTRWQALGVLVGLSLASWSLAHADTKANPAPIPAAAGGERVDVAKEAELGGKFVFFWPLDEVQVNSGFGMRRDPVKRSKKSKVRLHAGIDLAGEVGDTVLAAGPGRVLNAGWSSGYGNYVLIKHEDGYLTHYGHLSEVLVFRGQAVRQGAPVGLVGSTGHSTGPHLHFGLSKDGLWKNPLKLIGTDSNSGLQVADPDDLRGNSEE
jgi:murein DD-endopeptidase MepM/ murein hydrolase activator NlpD